MVSVRQKAALAALLVLAAVAGAWLGAAAPGEHAPPAPAGPGHAASPEERCAHMPEHCAGGGPRG